MGPSAAIIFDFDGVLADSIGLYHHLYRDVALHFNRPVRFDTEDEFRDWYNPRWEENYRTLGFAGFLREQALAWVSERIDYDRVPLFPNVKEMVHRLVRAYPLGIASTTADTKIRQMLEKEGLLQYFTVVVGGGDDGSDKSRSVGEAWRSLGAPANRTIMVGDTTMDVLSARSWGLLSIGVTYGWTNRKRMETVHPTLLVENWAELEPSIEWLIAQEAG